MGATAETVFPASVLAMEGKSVVNVVDVESEAVAEGVSVTSAPQFVPESRTLVERSRKRDTPTPIKKKKNAIRRGNNMIDSLPGDDSMVAFTGELI